MRTRFKPWRVEISCGAHANLLPLSLSLLFAAGAGLAFALLSGWAAYGVAAMILVIAHLAPFTFFRDGLVFPFFGPAAVAWLCSAGAATFQHFFVRRQCGARSRKNRDTSRRFIGRRTKCARR